MLTGNSDMANGIRVRCGIYNAAIGNDYVESLGAYYRREQNQPQL